VTANERPNLMTRSLLEVFNQRDRLDRAEAISQIYSIDVVFYEYDDTFAGRAALHGRVQQLLDDSPSFVTGWRVNHDSRLGPATVGIRAAQRSCRRFRHRHRSSSRRAHRGAVRLRRPAGRLNIHEPNSALVGLT
jgi:hypothetical protein